MNGAMISRWSHVTRQRGSLPLPELELDEFGAQRMPSPSTNRHRSAAPQGEADRSPFSPKSEISLSEGALRAHPHAKGMPKGIPPQTRG